MYCLHDQHAGPSAPSSRRLLLLLASVVVLGAAVRLYDLGERTISHPEFHTPGIEFADYVTHPNLRLTVLDVLEAPLLIHHPHLPGYEVIMLGWTRVFGTEMAAMRVSSVLFGILAVAGLIFFALRTSGPRTALLAAGLLALHGYHVFWSQQARPWVFISFVGITSAVLLLRVSERMSPGNAAAYLAVCAVGLWSDFYFWPVFAAQMIWVAFVSAGDRRLSPVFALQCMALLLAAPTVLYFLRFSAQASHLEGSIWPGILFVVRFVGLIRTRWLEGEVVLPPVVSTLLAVAGAAVLIAGISTRSRGPAWQSRTGGRTRPVLVVGLVAAAAGSAVLAHLVFGRIYDGRKLLLATQLLPFPLLAVVGVAYWLYPKVAPVLRRLADVPGIGRVLADLPIMLAVGALGLLTALQLAKGVLASYALVSLAPYFMLLTARGVLRPGPRLRTAGVVVLVGLCAYSTYDHGGASNSPQDYKALAEALIPNTKPGDVFVVEDQWWLVPIHYYLPPDEFVLVPADELAAMCESLPPPQRVWVVNFGETEFLEPRLEETLCKLPAGYTGKARISVDLGAAILLEFRATEDDDLPRR